MIHFFSVGKPILASPLSPKKRTLNWRPRTAEEIGRQKNRKTIGQYLKRIGKASGRDLHLGEDGVCVFSFKKFVVVVEVPEDHSSVVSFQATISQLRPEDNQYEVKMFLNSYNYQQARSNSDLIADFYSASNQTAGIFANGDSLGVGMRLVLKDHEVNLVFSSPIQGLSFQETADSLEHFLRTAVVASRRLDKVKPLPVPQPLLHLPEVSDTETDQTEGRFRRLWSLDSQSSVSDLSQCSVFRLFMQLQPTVPETSTTSA